MSSKFATEDGLGVALNVLQDCKRRWCWKCSECHPRSQQMMIVEKFFMRQHFKTFVRFKPQHLSGWTALSDTIQGKQQAENAWRAPQKTKGGQFLIAGYGKHVSEVLGFRV